MAGGHGSGGICLGQPTRSIQVAAGDNEFPQWERVGEHISGGGTQPIVTAVSKVGIVIRLPGSVLFAAVIGERSIRATDQIKVPRRLAEKRSRRLRSADRGTKTAPQIAESLPGVTVFPTGETCRGHASEELRLLRLVANRGKHHCSDGILAVVLMVGPRFVLAIRNGTLVGKVTEKPSRTDHGPIDFRVLHTAFVGQYDGEVRRESSHVDWTVRRYRTIKFTILAERGKTMAEGAIHTLAAGQLQSTFFDPGQYLLVAGNHVIFADKQQAIAHVPSIAPVGADGFLVRIEIFLGQIESEVAQLW